MANIFNPASAYAPRKLRIDENIFLATTRRFIDFEIGTDTVDHVGNFFFPWFTLQYAFDTMGNDTGLIVASQGSSGSITNVSNKNNISIEGDLTASFTGNLNFSNCTNVHVNLNVIGSITLNNCENVYLYQGANITAIIALNHKGSLVLRGDVNADLALDGTGGAPLPEVVLKGNNGPNCSVICSTGFTGTVDVIDSIVEGVINNGTAGAVDLRVSNSFDVNNELPPITGSFTLLNSYDTVIDGDDLDSRNTEKFPTTAAVVQYVADNAGGGSEVAVSFAHFIMNNDETTNTFDNDHLKFAGTRFNNTDGVTLNDFSPYTTTSGIGSIGRVTLQPGSTYDIEAFAFLSSIGGFSCDLGLYDVTTGTPVLMLSDTALARDYDNTARTVVKPTMNAIITPLVPTLIEVRMIGGGNGLLTFEANNGGRALSYMKITQVTASAGISQKLLLDSDLATTPLTTATPLVIDIPAGYNRIVIEGVQMHVASAVLSSLELNLSSGVGVIDNTSSYVTTFSQIAAAAAIASAQLDNKFILAQISKAFVSDTGLDASYCKAEITLRDKTSAINGSHSYDGGLYVQTLQHGHFSGSALKPTKLQLRMTGVNLTRGLLKVVAHKN